MNQNELERNQSSELGVGGSSPSARASSNRKDLTLARGIIVGHRWQNRCHGSRPLSLLPRGVR